MLTELLILPKKTASALAEIAAKSIGGILFDGIDEIL